MRILTNRSVYEAALARIEFLYKEFEEVVVGFSGGKDSAVVLNLAFEVAEKLDRFPVKVFFLDQEAEWQGTIDYVKEVMYDDRVEPYWLQVPLEMTNNASSYDRYCHTWEEGGEWIREKDPISIKENTYGKKRFHEMFKAFMGKEFDGKKSCYIAGVRTEEAPKRFMSLTGSVTYKHITWGRVLDSKKGHYTFYPIYDWSYKDVWAYIYRNDLIYNKVYDELYRHGVGLNDMRISNLHHETAIQTLLLIQEIEPDTWNKVQHRVAGASAIKHLKRESFTCPGELPSMFGSWEEYGYYLIENIIQEDEKKEKVRRLVESKWGVVYREFSERLRISFWHIIINTVLSSDYDFTKYKNWTVSHNVMAVRRLINKQWHKLDIKNYSNIYFEERHKKELYEGVKKHRKEKLGGSQG